MKSIITIASLIGILAIHGCSLSGPNLAGASRLAQGIVKVSGTSYIVYMLISSNDKDYDDPLKDPNVKKHFYAEVGPGAKVYCGKTREGCEGAIRRFNRNQQSSEESSDSGMSY